MIKLLAVVISLHVAVCQNLVDRHYQDLIDIKTVKGLQCSKLEGSVENCLACYPCDDDKIKHGKTTIHKLEFSSSNCTKDELCCIDTDALTARTNDDSCGKHNPQGNPRSRRPNLRAVLERQYPWRAWVYRTIIEQPLCAATYIFFGVNALVTTASCISGHQPSDLIVKFSKTQQIPDYVQDIVIHPNYSKQTKGGNINDIAILTLSKKPDSRVVPACIDSDPPLFATSCVIVSDSETFINTAIPLLQKCKKDNVNIVNNVTCSYLMKGDYTPQRGAGLYCMIEHSATPAYSLQGIYQADHSTPQLIVYTSIHQFANWIFITTNALKKAIHG